MKTLIVAGWHLYYPTNLYSQKNCLRAKKIVKQKVKLCSISSGINHKWICDGKYFIISKISIECVFLTRKAFDDFDTKTNQYPLYFMSVMCLLLLEFSGYCVVWFLQMKFSFFACCSAFWIFIFISLFVRHIVNSHKFSVFNSFMLTGVNEINQMIFCRTQQFYDKTALYCSWRCAPSICWCSSI